MLVLFYCGGYNMGRRVAAAQTRSHDLVVNIIAMLAGISWLVLKYRYDREPQ